MEANPRSGLPPLVLPETAPDYVGYVYHYESNTVTRVETKSFRVIIAVDTQGNPFIVTAFPELR